MKKKEKYIPYNYEESTDTRPEELDETLLAWLREAWDFSEAK